MKQVSRVLSLNVTNSVTIDPAIFCVFACVIDWMMCVVCFCAACVWVCVCAPNYITLGHGRRVDAIHISSVNIDFIRDYSTTKQRYPLNIMQTGTRASWCFDQHHRFHFISTNFLTVRCASLCTLNCKYNRIWFKHMYHIMGIYTLHLLRAGKFVHTRVYDMSVYVHTHYYCWRGSHAHIALL